MDQIDEIISLLFKVSGLPPFFTCTISSHFYDLEYFIYVFQYIRLLKMEGVQEWIFEEKKKLEEVTFLFKDKESPSSYVVTLAAAMDVGSYLNVYLK